MHIRPLFIGHQMLKGLNILTACQFGEFGKHIFQLSLLRTE